MTTAITTTNGTRGVATYDAAFSREQLDLLKRTVAAGTSDDEFALFCEVARTTGLNPFQRQVYAIMRETWDPRTKSKTPKMTIQTGIDGYRLLAARTGAHVGTTDPVFDDEKANRPAWARVTVYRLVGGHKAEFPATARWSEYAQTDREGKPTGQWGKMPFLMLAKCAEALALRKAFPVELSGVYAAEEMSQADAPTTPPARNITPAPTPPLVDQDTGEVYEGGDDEAPFAWTPSAAQLRRIYDIAKKNGIAGKEELRDWMGTVPGFPAKETQLTRAQYDEACDHRIPAYGAYLKSREAGKAPIEVEVVDADELALAGATPIGADLDDEDMIP